MIVSFKYTLNRWIWFITENSSVSKTDWALPKCIIYACIDINASDIKYIIMQFNTIDFCTFKWLINHEKEKNYDLVTTLFMLNVSRDLYVSQLLTLSLGIITFTVRFPMVWCRSIYKLYLTLACTPTLYTKP